MLQLIEAYTEYNIFFVTFHSGRDNDVERIAPAYFTKNIGTNIPRNIAYIFWSLLILYREKPDVILTTGAHIALPFLYWAKILDIKTIFIESWCRINELSLSGRLAYPVANVFLVQWPQLLEACGSKARFLGAVI